MGFAVIGTYVLYQVRARVLDREGVICYMWVSENPGIEPNYKEIEAELAKLD